MKLTLLMLMICFSGSAFASDCLIKQASDISPLTDQITDALKVKYTCSIKNIINGQYLMGSGTNIYVDSVNGTAEVTSIAGFPPFQETTESVLKKEINNNDYPRFVATTEHGSISFTLGPDGSATGPVVRKTIWNDKETIEAYICSVAKE